MIIRKAEYETCKACGSRKRVKDEAHGCESCGKPIDLYDPDADRLDVQVFRHRGGEDCKRHHFCSWACVFKKLKALCRGVDYFVSLPYLNFDSTTPGTRATDFWRAVKEYGKGKP